MNVDKEPREVFVNTRPAVEQTVYSTNYSFSDSPPPGVWYCKVFSMNFEQLHVCAAFEAWLADTSSMSSTQQIESTDSYKRMIGVGSKWAVPLLLAKLEEGVEVPAAVFHTLQLLTGKDPVPVEDRGDYDRMAQCWIAWGKSGLAVA